VGSGILIKFSNFASTGLQKDVAQFDNYVQVATKQGELFPDIDSHRGEYFLLTLVNPKTSTFEIMKVTEKLEADNGVPGNKDLFKVVRGLENTTPQYFTAG
jgi:hypothetical protein